MPEQRRREGEPGYEDPSSQSIMKKAAKLEFGNPYIDTLLRVIVLVVMGGGAGIVTSESKNSEVAHMKEQLARHEADVEKYRTEAEAKWQRFYQGRRNERQVEQGNSVCFERRFSRIEARAGIEAPPCVAAAAAAVDAAAAPVER